MINFNSEGPSSLLQQVQGKKTDLMEKLANGKQVNNASDGAAAQQIIDRLTSQVEGSRQAVANAYDGISLVQVAEGGLANINEDVSRIRELTLQAGNGILSDSDREAIQSEISALQDNISLTAEQTSFAGKPLLNESSQVSFQVGANAGEAVDVQTNDVVRELNGVLSIDVISGDINEALDATDAALESVGGFQANLGATQNQLASSARSMTQSDVSTAAARGRIQDLDYAQAVTQSVSHNILSQASTSVQSQANQQQGQVLALLS